MSGAILCKILFAIQALHGQGADRWVGGSGDWFDGMNWDAAGPPTGSLNAYIANGGTAFITSGGAVCLDLFVGFHTGPAGPSGSGGPGELVIAAGLLQNRSGYVGGYFGSDTIGTGRATVTGGSSEWLMSGQGSQLVVGGSADGTLDVSSGGLVSSGAGYVGLLSGVHGIVNVDGNLSIWKNSSPLQIGVSGMGTVNITNLGEVTAYSGQIASNVGSVGTLRVDGSDQLGTSSSWIDSHGLFVGYKGSGAFSVTNAGTASSAFGSIGVFDTANGTATVDNADWTIADFLEIGSDGTGTLNITNGGVVSNVDGYVGSNSGSSGTVNVGDFGPGGSTSSWKNSGTLYVGYDGTGTVNINLGGAVSSENGNIGRDAGSEGTVNVNGGEWSLTDPIGSSLIVGYYGTGKLNITNAGTVSNDGGYIGYHAFSSGTVTVDGSNSIWTNNFGLTVGLEGTGSLSVTDGGQVKSDSGVVGGGSGGNGDVFISGSGDISSNWTVANELQVGVDDATGHIIVADAGILKAGSLIIGTGTHDSSAPLSATVEVGHAAAYISDQLIVGNTALGQLTIESNGLVLVADPNQINPTESYIGHDVGAKGTVNVDGAGSKFSTSGSLLVGYNGTGTLNITQGGAVDNSSGFIGFDPGSTGAVNVDGAGSTWENSFLSVGNRGTGTLDVSNGGTVTTSHGYVGRYVGSVGTVSLDGAGSTWTTSSDLNIGMEGTGAVTITNHAVMMSDSGVIGGTTQGESGGTSGNGAVTINGAGSSWSVAHELDVGVNDSTGSVVAENGGILQADTLIIGTGTHDSAAPLSATVNLNGGTLNATSITVGDTSLGALNIDNNSSASTTDLIIGATTSGDGQVSVIANSSLSAANVTVGNLGSGQLDITGNSVVTVSTKFIIGENGSGAVSSEASSVTVTSDVVVGDTSLGVGSLKIGNAANWSINGNLIIGNNGVGTTDVANGGSVTATSVQIGARGTLGGNGMVNANVTNNGLISPGNSPGILQINGNYTQNSGALNIEIAGLTAGSFDVLNVSGSAILSGGALHFLFLNGFLPKTGDIVQFLVSGSPPLINLANITIDYSGAAPGFEFAVAPVANGLEFVALTDAQAVPEPGTIVLLGIAGVAIAGLGRRRS